MKTYHVTFSSHCGCVASLDIQAPDQESARALAIKEGKRRYFSGVMIVGEVAA